MEIESEVNSAKTGKQIKANSTKSSTKSSKISILPGWQLIQDHNFVSVCEQAINAQSSIKVLSYDIPQSLR